jgi:3-phosphoshikimate 1-carboxyvinyltransferase
VTVDGSVTSQHVTGLLLALALAAEDTRLTVIRPTSRPYLRMTLRTLEAFGIGVEAAPDCSAFRLPGRQRYRPTDYLVEGDWSGASCLLVAGAIAGRVEIDNLDTTSLQADRAILDVLRQAGARVAVEGRAVTVERRDLSAFEWDAADAPDLVPALVAPCHCPDAASSAPHDSAKKATGARAAEMVHAMAPGDVRRGRPRGDRTGFRRPGRDAASPDRDGGGGRTAKQAAHDAACVGKSYPRFFDDLRRLGVQP